MKVSDSIEKVENQFLLSIQFNSTYKTLIMKHSFLKAILFCLFLFTSIFAKAQEVKTYTQSTDSLLTYVDIKQAKTGTLYDRVFPFAHLKEATDTTNAEHFKQAYSELYRASYNPDFKHLEIVKAELKRSYSKLNQVPIGF